MFFVHLNCHFYFIFDRIVQSEGGIKIEFCKGTFILIWIFRKIGYGHPKNQKKSGLISAMCPSTVYETYLADHNIEILTRVICR